MRTSVSRAMSRRPALRVETGGAKEMRAVTARCRMMSPIDCMKVISPTKDAARQSVPSGCS